MKTTILPLLLLLWVSLVLPGQTTACVGKTLVIGSTGTLQQEVLAELLAVLIAERTGTTVKVVQFKSVGEAHQALLQADLDMVVGYTGVSQVEILHGPAIADRAQLYEAVKGAFNQDLNLVWLQPLGFDEPRVAPQGATAEAAPVVRKDTLKKFPALARLINKLGGKVDADAMLAMERQAAEQPPKQVAREFLKQNRLI